MPCFLNFCPWESPGVSGGTMNEACPLDPSSGSTTATTTWTLAMPPLVAQVLVPFSTHSSLAWSYTARVRIEATSELAVRLRGAEGRDLDVVGVAVHLRDPGADLLLGAVGEDAHGRQARTDDGQGDARVPPEELLHRHRDAEARRVEELLGVEVEGVDADLGRLLDDGPGRFLTLVPLRSRRTDHIRGEAVKPVTDLLLVVVEFERELRHVPLHVLL